MKENELTIVIMQGPKKKASNQYIDEEGPACKGKLRERDCPNTDPYSRFSAEKCSG